MMKTVNHISVAYDEKTATEISMLRAQRWGHLTTISHMQTIDTRAAKDECTKLWRKVARIDHKLHKLTGNPVYK